MTLNFLVKVTLVFWPAALAFSAPQNEKVSLEDCFRAAVKRSEIVATQQELIRQAEAAYRQAIGSVLPNISGSGSYQWQQGQPGGTLSTIFPNPSMFTKLTVTQPIFQGFKEFAALRQTQSAISAYEFDKKQAAAQLYMDTATSFFTVLAMEHDAENVVDELHYYESRIAELKQFNKVGRIQVGDVLTAQAQQASLRAQLKQINGQIRAQRAVLAFLTGFDTEVGLSRPSEDVNSAKTLDVYLRRLDQRPDVQAEKARARAADELIPIARAGHFPTVSLQGDYFLQRTGALQDVNWDVLVLLNVPIFSGGVVQNQIEQAVSKRDQQELQVSRVRRLAEQQVRQFYENYVGSKEQFEGFREATELSEKNYKEELREFRYGLVTNLDVLNALTTFQESKRAYDKARYSALLGIESLEAASAFKPTVPAADEKKTLN